MAQEKLLKVADVAEIFGVSKATIWNWLHTKPTFPKPHKLTKQITIWRQTEINAFIDAEFEKRA